MSLRTSDPSGARVPYVRRRALFFSCSPEQLFAGECALTTTPEKDEGVLTRYRPVSDETENRFLVEFVKTRSIT